MSADLEFFDPDNAPRELLDAVRRAHPGRRIEWLTRHRLDSAVGGYLAGQIAGLVRTTEGVARVVMDGTHVVFAGMGGLESILPADGKSRGKRRAHCAA